MDTPLCNGFDLILKTAAMNHAKKNGAGEEELEILATLSGDMAWKAAIIVYGEPNSAKDDDSS